MISLKSYISIVLSFDNIVRCICIFTLMLCILGCGRSKSMFNTPDSIQEYHSSADMKYTALLLYGRSTGPEGGKELVTITEAGKEPERDQDGKVKEIIFDGFGMYNITLKWTGARKLKIDGVCGDRSQRKGYDIRMWHDVEITYPYCTNQ